MSVTSIRLQPEIEQSLEGLAAELQRSKNWIINEALRDYLSRQRLEAERWRETLEALESVKTGTVIDGEDVHRWLESWGTEHERAPPER